MTREPTYNVPAEFDLPSGYGFTMKGWDFSTETVRRAIEDHRMLNPAFELGTNVCPWNCDFCFTESPSNPAGLKRRLDNELPLERRLRLIDEAGELGAQSINFVGAGEPTIDPDFLPLVDRIADRGMTPIIYTEGSLRLKNRDFAKRLLDLGATIVLKVNSLHNPSYQDAVVRGLRPKLGVPQKSYTAEREKALNVLFDLGFNTCNPTRLAFDTIICRENVAEIEDIHRFARLNNVFVLFVNYLPSGRTHDGHTGAISGDEQLRIFESLGEIDRTVFGISHRTHFPYAGGVPCTIRGLGLYVKVEGGVYDCPGEAMAIGNLRSSTLAELWDRVRPITASFDGGCYPRAMFWKSHLIEGLRAALDVPSRAVFQPCRNGASPLVQINVVKGSPIARTDGA